jgi:hypothetical protein
MHRPLVLALGTGFLAGIGVAVSTVHALQIGWVPISDDGVIAMRAFDVLGGHTPLVGQYTQASGFVDHPTFGLGPLLYWLLAVPAQIGPSAMVLTVAAVNLACVMGAVAIAASRGGPGLMFAAALAMVVMGRSLPIEAGYEIFNPWAALFPFTLLLFVAWAVGCGEHRLLPLLVLVASFVAQCHLTYLLPVVGLVAVAATGLGASGRWRTRWTAAALIVGIFCWSGPLIYELRHEPGNLELVFRAGAADRPTTGIDSGLYVLARTVGVAPWWAQDTMQRDERIREVLAAPSALTIVTAALVVACLPGMFVAALRRRRRDIAVAIAIALVLCAAVAATAASLPTTIVGLSTLGWVLNWTSQAGAWVWLVLACSAWALFVAPRGVELARGRAAVFAGLGATLLLSVLVASRPGDDPNRQPPGIKDFAMVDKAVSRTRAAIAGHREVLIVPAELSRTLGPLTLRSAIGYDLRRHGVTVAFPEQMAMQVGPDYYPHKGRYESVVSITDGETPTRPGDRLLLRDRDKVAVAVAHAPFAR